MGVFVYSETNSPSNTSQGVVMKLTATITNLTMEQFQALCNWAVAQGIDSKDMSVK